MTTVDWSQRFGFGQPRPTNQIRDIFIHTTENQPSTRAEDVAQYQINSESGSYHRLVDRTKTLIANTDNWLTWSTGNYGNDIGLHLSFVAAAAMTRQAWLDEEKQYGTITRAAHSVAEWSTKYQIPLVPVDGAGLKTGKRGVSTHNAARVWGNTDHTDPGSGFPMDVLLARAADIQRPIPRKEPDMSFTDEDRKKLEAVYHELTHRFASRVDLDAKRERPFTDTAIGYALEADRKLELADGTKLGAALKSIASDLEAIKARLDQDGR